MKRLKGKKVLVTGGSSGIGQAIALAYAKEGAIVAFSYFRNQVGAMATLRQLHALGSEGFAFSANLAKISAISKLFNKTIQTISSLDILINNAGTVSRQDNFLSIPLEALEHVETVNLKAPFLLMQLAASHMIAKKIAGNIINISSMSTEIITPGLTHYECTKKSRVKCTNQRSRKRSSSLSIRVNAIAPGLVETAINQDQREKDPENWSLRSSKIPLGRAGLPADIANLTVFLATPEAEWITGSIISVDGGLGVASPFKK